MRELELENEYEFENQSEFLEEYEGELEGFGEGEGAFGEGPLGEFELEGAFGESLGEGAFGEASNEQFLGPIARGVGSLLGLGESEYEFEGLGEGEYEGEQFLGGLFKKAAGFVKQNAPMLKKIAKFAAPIVGTAIGGPIGAKLGSVAANLLGESEFESEFEYEATNEAEMELVMEGPMSEQQALGELMAAAASRAATDMEAETQIGSATTIILSRADLAALRNVLPNINRGVAVLTRILRRQPGTRDAIRTIPTIIKRSAVSLRNRQQNGQPVTRNVAARTVASQTRRVLGTPSVCAKAMQRNVQATKAVARKSSNGAATRPQRYAI